MKTESQQYDSDYDNLVRDAMRWRKHQIEQPPATDDKQWTEDTVEQIWSTVYESGVPFSAMLPVLFRAVASQVNAALAAEREKSYLRDCEQHGRDEYVRKLRAALGLKVGESLTESARKIHQQLLQAQAAIAEHNRFHVAGCGNIIIDLSALDRHDAEVQKPLVDALENAKTDIAALKYHHLNHQHQFFEGTSKLALQRIDAAIADAKTDRASDEIVRQG